MKIAFKQTKALLLVVAVCIVSFQAYAQHPGRYSRGRGYYGPRIVAPSDCRRATVPTCSGYLPPISYEPRYYWGWYTVRVAVTSYDCYGPYVPCTKWVLQTVWGKVYY